MKDKLRIITGELTKAHPTDAGYDIKTIEYKNIPPGKAVSIKTGLRIKLPKGTTGFIKSRSGLMFNHDIISYEGVIDESYTGEVGIKLCNMGSREYSVYPGERVAQLVVLPIFTGEVIRVETVEETDRSDSGFGSSGK